MMITANELNKTYTDIVANYVNDGYMINPNSFGGRQSNEICHIDLKHPKDTKNVIRVWMTNYSEKLKIDGEEVWGGADTIRISVRKYDQTSLRNTLWSDEGEELVSIKFYTIEKDSFYTSELDDLISIIKLRNKRYSARTIFKPDYGQKLLNIHTLPSSTINSIVSKIKANYGCKKAGADSIKQVALNTYSGRLNCRVDWEFKNHRGIIVLK